MFHRHVTRLFVLCAAGILIFMTNPQIDKIGAAPEKAVPNPLTEKWEGPYGGIPPFDKVKVSKNSLNSTCRPRSRCVTG